MSAALEHGVRVILVGNHSHAGEQGVIVGGDREIVDDVMELDADCLTFNSTRRDEWDARVGDALRGV